MRGGGADAPIVCGLGYAPITADADITRGGMVAGTIIISRKKGMWRRVEIPLRRVAEPWNIGYFGLYLVFVFTVPNRKALGWRHV